MFGRSVRMSEPLKILPALMVTCGILFSFKAVGLWSDVRSELVGLRPALASGAAPESSGHGAAMDGHGDNHADKSDDHGADHTTDHSEDHSGDRPGDHASDHGQDASAEAHPTTDLIPSSLMSAAEVDVLESLSARRQELDKRGRELDMREKLVIAQEAKVDQKISEMHAIEDRLKGMLGQLDDEEAQQIESLIKVYEAMKAKDAARIFENLNKDILLDVAAGMKEAKMAAIMAAMDSKKAQQLTVLLATRLDLPEDDTVKSIRSSGRTDG